MTSKLNIYTSDILEIRSILDKYGVAVLTNYFDKAYADEVFSYVKEWLIGLIPKLTHDTKTWTNSNLPLGPRYGMYQSIISNCPKFWELREKFYPIFAKILDEAHLLVSADGASFFPTNLSPKKKEDWAHIDQTICSDFMCYQSQFVASDTLASFVCTPGSHLKHKNILKKYSIETDRNWYKFTPDNVADLKKMFGEYYQVPIPAPKGSVIFWDSRTIHSSKYPDVKDNSWRAVFYISMRPKYAYTIDNIRTIQQAIINGKTTNHWGTVIFKPNDRFKLKDPSITNLEKNSKKISYHWFLSSLQRKMCAIPNEFDQYMSTKENCLTLLKFCLEENLIADPVVSKFKEIIDFCYDASKIKYLQGFLLMIYNQNKIMSTDMNSQNDNRNKIIIIKC